MIKQYINTDDYNQIESFVNDFNKNKSYELEASLRVQSNSDFVSIVEHFIDISSENDISSQTSLDILIGLAIGPDKGNTYRVSMLDSDEIDKFLEQFTRKNVGQIQSYLTDIKKSKKYEIIIKESASAKRLIISDFDLVIKISKETPSDSSAIKNTLTGKEKMLYRYKKRYSFIKGNFRYDFTEVQQAYELWNLSKSRTTYELEIEAVNKINTDELIGSITDILKLTQKTSLPISKTETLDVINKYTQLLNLSKSDHLDVRNVVSIETQHLRFIPNRYAVTEKADGDRCCLFIISEGVYLLSTNLDVRKTLLTVTDKKYHNTLIDGELITLDDGLLFMGFDVIYHNSIDYRTSTKHILVNRIDALNDIVDKCFGNLIEFNHYMDKNTTIDYDKIAAFYQIEIVKYWKRFNSQIKKSNSEIFVTRKIHFVPYGIDESEVFLYANIIWKNLFYNNIAPYKLDGIIYTPLNTPYTIKVKMDLIDTVPMEYKWKTSSQNSIDFFIRFEKNDNGEDIIYFDDATVKTDAPSYKICGLYVGINKGKFENPVPFKVNGVEQKANIYVTDGEAVDIEGNVINDDTVVEFVFDTTKPDLPNPFKWTALRTRHDKTDSVRKYKKKYGNSLGTAIRIWKTIINPISEESIAILANPQTYKKEMDRLLNTNNSYVEKGFVYYQKVSENAKSMRAFNNWIKSNMISTYCKDKPSVLDIGCGRGGDLLKFINAGIGEYVGLDIDRNGLYVISGSAFNRYKGYSAKLKNVPPMYFIHADARAKFNVADQEAVISNMNVFNKTLIDKYLSGAKKYSVINAQFTLHYYLSDDISWNNFCKNINDHLESGGHVLITGFDGKLIYDNLKNKQKMTVSYTDDSGKKVIFFEIVKAFANDSNKGLGMAIDLYNSLYSNPDTYIREYLIFPEFLIKSLKEKCDLDLVETDSFYNLFNLYKEYFTNEENISDEINARYKIIKEFYQSIQPNTHTDVSIDAARASFKLSMLNRYYVFKKSTKNNINNQARVVGINHKINLGNMITPYFTTNNMIIQPNMKSNNINQTYKDICRKYPTIKPNVYIVRHTVPSEQIDNDNFTRNKFEFVRAKQSDHDKVLLIYKSPEKYYYPIYFKYKNDNAYDIDDSNFYTDTDIKNSMSKLSRVDKLNRPSNKLSKSKYSDGTYMLESSKILDDLEIMVYLTNKSNNNY